jgi:hypothetical protein
VAVTFFLPFFLRRPEGIVSVIRDGQIVLFSFPKTVLTVGKRRPFGGREFSPTGEHSGVCFTCVRPRQKQL